MDPFVMLTAAAAVTQTLEARHRHLPDRPARPDPDREAGRLDRPGLRRPLPVWYRQRLEPGGDRANHGTVFATRHKLARERVAAMQAIWTKQTGIPRRVRRFRPDDSPGRSRCRSRIRRSSSAARSHMPRAGRSVTVTAGSRTPAGRIWRCERFPAAVPPDGHRSRARSGLTADHHLPRRGKSGPPSTLSRPWRRSRRDQHPRRQGRRGPPPARPLGSPDRAAGSLIPGAEQIGRRAVTPRVMPTKVGIHDLPSCCKQRPGSPASTGMTVRVPAKS